ncbi:MAG: GNAT family N-acetyltransferase [Burkholderiales bacterium]|nr:GNAT family N-acetyltransferase [Anaerolineae bacterium]
MNIRPLVRDDVDALAALWGQLIIYHQALDPSLPGPARNGARRYAQRLIERIDDRETLTLVADIDGEVVGFALGMVVDLAPDVFAQEKSGFLADIFVNEDHRRHGIGRALVEALERWFNDEHELQHYEWHVAAQNPEARAFWQSIGGRDVMVRMRVDLSDAPQRQSNNG